jgi:predicted DsbA family dithiol-disulfide isomerase
MSNWFHRFFNPHCPDCIAESTRICESCETLKTEIARISSENERLLNRLLNPPTIHEEKKELSEVLKMPRNIPWNVRRQMLEAEDREKAKLMKEAPKPQSTTELEKELGVEEK